MFKFAKSAGFTFAVLCVASMSLGKANAFEPAAERQRELISLVRQDCGSCHGLSLAGGLGPALLPGYLADKQVDCLVATVMQGRPGTAMPGWGTFMDAQEAAWIVRMLKSGFPK